MLNNKEKIITFRKKGVLLLRLILKGCAWCMCSASIFFWLMGILFLITGDQNIFFHKKQFQ